MYAMACTGVGMDACTKLDKVTACPLGKWSAIQYSADTMLVFHVGGFKTRARPQ